MLRAATSRLAVRAAGLRALSAQAPTVAKTETKTWSEHQADRKGQMVGPRFKSADLSAQPLPVPAIDLIAQAPIHKTTKRVVSCDGGGGALGHPRIYINLDEPGPQSCGYCGNRFELDHHHHH